MIKDHAVETYRRHSQEVCGLKWSSTRKQLLMEAMTAYFTSGINLWRFLILSHGLHKLEDHRAAVKSLAWCPFQSNLLTFCGGSNDQCIKFWKTHTGACLIPLTVVLTFALCYGARRNVNCLADTDLLRTN